MNDSGLVTRCPHCDTSFRVTQAQLNAARGAVRCGACLAVFLAPDHLVLSDEPTHEEIPETPLDAEERDWEEASTYPVAEDTEDVSEASGDPAAAYWEDDQEDDQEDNQEDDKESLEGIGSERQDDSVRYGESTEAGIPDESRDETRLEIDPSQTIEAFEYQSQDQQVEEPDWDDEPGAALPEVDDDTRGPDASDDAGETAEESFTHDASGDGGDLPDFGSVHEEFDDGEFSGHLDVEPDAVEIVEHPLPPPVRHRVVWAAGAVVLVLVLAIQVLWFNRDTFSQDIAVRGYYETACRVLPCDLPVYADSGALHTTDLVVRTHPSIDNALVVDAIIRNDAPWRQVFPRLELEFSDIHNQRIAARTFRPAEYLGGELTGLKYIPGRTEVRISLEIVDPGKQATNYSLLVRR